MSVTTRAVEQLKAGAQSASATLVGNFQPAHTPHRRGYEIKVSLDQRGMHFFPILTAGPAHQRRPERESRSGPTGRTVAVVAAIGAAHASIRT